MRFRLQVLNKIEESPWTRSWDHLHPLPKSILSRLRTQKSPIPVPAKDRIKQWNIVPGDRVCIRGDETGSIREVFGVNKYRNLVYLKGRYVRSIPKVSELLY